MYSYINGCINNNNRYIVILTLIEPGGDTIFKGDSFVLLLAPPTDSLLVFGFLFGLHPDLLELDVPCLSWAKARAITSSLCRRSSFFFDDGECVGVCEDCFGECDLGWKCNLTSTFVWGEEVDEGTKGERVFSGERGSYERLS